MSGYAELPSGTERERSKVEVALGRAEKIAGSLGEGLGGGLRDASRALASPKGSDVEGLIASTDLPELSGADALSGLAARLDREADLWRNLAFRELANVRFTHRLLQGVAGLLVVSTLALATLAGLSALFGAAPERAILIGVASVVLAIGAGVFAFVIAIVRRGQRDTLREALARADLAELRLHRIAIAIAARAAAPDKAVEVLGRLERDARG